MVLNAVATPDDVLNNLRVRDGALRDTEEAGLGVMHVQEIKNKRRHMRVRAIVKR
jgi:hypothetical protein